jgi:hypothetical protein
MSQDPRPEPRLDSESAPDEPALRYCPVCDTRLEDRSCKLVCPRCGYFMSCSDFY